MTTNNLPKPGSETPEPVNETAKPKPKPRPRPRKPAAASKAAPQRRLTPTELRAITFVGTLILAGIAIAMRVDSSVVWTFLALAIGTAFNQVTRG